MKLNDIHFHDSIIYRVTEDTEKDSLTFEVDYPVDWKRSIFRAYPVRTDIHYM